MKAVRHIRTVVAVCVALFAVLAVDATTFAQCAMCKTALAGSASALFIRNFNIGVLVLLIPPVTIFCSIFIALRRYKGSEEG